VDLGPEERHREAVVVGQLVAVPTYVRTADACFYFRQRQFPGGMYFMRRIEVDLILTDIGPEGFYIQKQPAVSS
jgi:hypothetical protein